MPSTQKKLTLLTKSSKSASPQIGEANMTDQDSPLLSRAEIDSLVKRISTEVLKGVETSFEKKSTRSYRSSMKLGLLDTRITEMEGWISDTMASYGTKITEVENKLEAALDKIDNLENRSRCYNVCTVPCESIHTPSFFSRFMLQSYVKLL